MKTFCDFLCNFLNNNYNYKVLSNNNIYFNDVKMMLIYYNLIKDYPKNPEKIDSTMLTSLEGEISHFLYSNYKVFKDNNKIYLDTNSNNNSFGFEKFYINYVNFVFDFHIKYYFPVTISEIRTSNKFWYEDLIYSAYKRNILRSLPIFISIKVNGVYDVNEFNFSLNLDNLGIDLRSAVDTTIESREAKLIDTGLVVRVFRPFGLYIFPRSSLYKNKKCILANSVGVIDYNYCGNDDTIKLNLINLSNNIVKINKGERLCQMVLINTLNEFKFVFVDNIKEISRGGFGQSGIF